MLQLENSTPFAALITVFPNEEGVDTLYTMVRATFQIGDGWSLVNPQLEVQQEDVYVGEPAQSSIIVPSDIHPGKPETDVLMIGSAYAPDGQAVKSMCISMQLAELRKDLVVTGDRVWQNGEPSDPEPFSSMPVVYERGFGGVRDSHGKVDAIEENPIGVGYAADRNAEEMEGLPLPNIEYPDQLIQTIKDKPRPAGYGAIAPQWQPRVSRAGSYDQLWQEARAPYLPLDYTSRFCNCAPADQIYPGYLQGGEPLRIEGMNLHGVIETVLPRINLRCSVIIGDAESECPVVLETLLLQPNQMQISFSWKAAFVCDKVLPNIQTIKLSLLR